MDISGLLTVPNIIVLAFVAIFSALDETSRTVTDGEYSFFNEIKDQRDRGNGPQACRRGRNSQRRTP